MAEFVQTMKDWRRMCDAYTRDDTLNSCNMCPMLEYSFDKRGCDAIYSEFAIYANWEEVEKIICEWAADHPEPVYPTWFRWLEDVGIVSKSKSEYSHIYDTVVPTSKMFEPIPADIAQKLGVEPKK